MNTDNPQIEEAEYVVIWNREDSSTSADYGFAIVNHIDDEDCAYAAINLTAEEVGQLMGGN